ncbi:MAG: riboflavin synthase [Gammaproteobacteria bacterium]|nr:riboflavin synthase [Gammaproteobacteria bacterium]
MFTGIIQAIGKISVLERRGGDARLRVAAGGLDMADVKLGDSIAVSGVCLTAIELSAKDFAADVSGETLSRTTLGGMKPGAAVNLEKALLPTTRLGGHLVSGHVDGVGKVLDHRQDARSVRFRIAVPRELGKYIAEKGSVCINGVSLTVNAVHDSRDGGGTTSGKKEVERRREQPPRATHGAVADGAEFEVNIVPHTLAETTLGELAPGHTVNIEVDLLARYLERLLQGQDAAVGVTPELLARHGFV